MSDQSQQSRLNQDRSDRSRWTAYRKENQRRVNSQFSSNSLSPEMFPARHSAAFIIHGLFLCLTSVNKTTLHHAWVALTVQEVTSPISKWNIVLDFHSQRSSWIARTIIPKCWVRNNNAPLCFTARRHRDCLSGLYQCLGVIYGPPAVIRAC